MGHCDVALSIGQSCVILVLCAVTFLSVANPDMLDDTVLCVRTLQSPTRLDGSNLRSTDGMPAVWFGHRLGFRASHLLHNHNELHRDSGHVFIVNYQLHPAGCLFPRPPSTSVSPEVGSDGTGGGSGIQTLSNLEAR